MSRWRALGESHYATAASCKPTRQPRPLYVHSSQQLHNYLPAVLTSTQTWSKPQHHCRPSPHRDRHRSTVQTSMHSPGTSSYQQVPMKTPQCPLRHPHCHPNWFHALVASHGHPNGTNLKQENGSLESSSLRFKLNRSKSSDWGGMKGLPLANRWPYTDGVGDWGTYYVIM